MFFFFFFDREKIRPGTVCKVSNSRNGPDFTVVVHQAGYKMQHGDEDILWAYENKPVRFRINNRGKTVIEFDPACVLSAYRYEDLIPTNEIPLQTAGWGAEYRFGRMI